MRSSQFRAPLQGFFVSFALLQTAETPAAQRQALHSGSSTLDSEGITRSQRGTGAVVGSRILGNLLLPCYGAGAGCLLLWSKAGNKPRLSTPAEAPLPAPQSVHHRRLKEKDSKQPAPFFRGSPVFPCCLIAAPGVVKGLQRAPRLARQRGLCDAPRPPVVPQRQVVAGAACRGLPPGRAARPRRAAGCGALQAEMVRKGAESLSTFNCVRWRPPGRWRPPKPPLSPPLRGVCPRHGANPQRAAGCGAVERGQILSPGDV